MGATPPFGGLAPRCPPFGQVVKVGFAMSGRVFRDAIARRLAALAGGIGALVAGVAAANPAQADNGPAAGYILQLGNTRVIGLSIQAMNSGVVRDAARYSYDLSGGERVDLSGWYTPQSPSLTAILATDLAPNVALIWGGSTGEQGQKYWLGPTGVLGLALQRPLDGAAQIRFEVVGYFGGALRESPCLGDYGALGGMQRVNCRLAASYLPPADTLPLMWNIPESTEMVVKMTYRMQF